MRVVAGLASMATVLVCGVWLAARIPSVIDHTRIWLHRGEDDTAVDDVICLEDRLAGYGRDAAAEDAAYANNRIAFSPVLYGLVDPVHLAPAEVTAWNELIQQFHASDH